MNQEVAKEMYMRRELMELKLQYALLKHAAILEGESNLTWQKIPQIFKKVPLEKIKESPMQHMAAYIRIGTKNEILEANQLALDILGYKSEQLLYRNLEYLLEFKSEEKQALFFQKLKNNTDNLEQWLIINNHYGNGLNANTLIKTANGEHHIFFVIP